MAECDPVSETLDTAEQQWIHRAFKYVYEGQPSAKVRGELKIKFKKWGEASL